MDDFSNFLKSLAMPIIATLVILGLTLYIFIPKFGDYKKMRSEIEAQKEKIVFLGQKLNDLNALSEKELEDNLNLTISAMPVEKDFYLVVSNIKYIFNQERIILPEFAFNVGDVSTASAEKKSKSTQENSFNINLAFSGPFENVEKAIARLENSIPLLSVDLIRLSTEKAASLSGDMVNYEGSMTLKSHFSAPPKNMGTVESPLPKIESAQKILLESLLSYEKYRILTEETPGGSAIFGRENPFSVF